MLIQPLATNREEDNNPMQTISCDVLVVGAGPAGSTVGKIVAETGADVVLIDRRKEVGTPVQCGEYLPWQVARKTEIEDGIASQNIICMHTHMPDGDVVETESNGYIINRNRFDQFLAKKAVTSGAELLMETEAVAFQKNNVKAVQDKKEIKIITKIIVGADGPKSTVGRWIHATNKELVHAMQHVMPLTEEMRSTEIYFRGYIPMGYGWVFPKGKVANVGVGVDPKLGITPKTALTQFIDELTKKDVIEKDILGSTGGLIPANGLLPKIHQENIVLVGDAAGQCHPITGAGVPNAIMCGELAGQVVSEAVASNDLEKLSEYPEECVELIGDTLKRAVEKRKFLYPYWNKSDTELSNALRKSWIAFEEYYDQRKS